MNIINEFYDIYLIQNKTNLFNISYFYNLQNTMEIILLSTAIRHL